MQTQGSGHPASRALPVGLFRAGGCRLALPVEALREVILRPPKLLPVPGAPGFVLGAADVRGAIIPVLDLGAALGLPQSGTDAGVIVVLRQFGRLVGLAAETVDGIATVARDNLRDVSAGTPLGHTLHTHTVLLNAEAIWLLEPTLIAALPGLPMTRETVATADARRVESKVTRLLFACGPFRFAIRAVDVDGTVARTSLLPSPIDSPLCHGVIEHRGRRIPVIDPLRLLGIGSVPQAAESPVLVLRCKEQGLVGLRIDAVQDMLDQTPDDVAPMPPLVVDDPTLFDGVSLDAAGHQHFVLSAEGLRNEHRVEAYARLSALGAVEAGASPAPGDGARVAHGLAQQVLVFSAVNRFAAPLLQVHEVIAMPAAVTPVDGSRGHLIGLFDHRGRPVPLVSFDRALGGRGRAGDYTRVLLVDSGGSMVGYAVEALHGIETARALQPHRRDGATATDASPTMDRLVDLGGEGGTVIPLLDLQALTHSIGAGTSGQATGRRDHVATFLVAAE